MNILNKYKISGAIGLSILKRENKEFYIFYDQHNNKNYCSNSNSKFLNNILEDNFINSDSLILLEELVNYGSSDNIITIWKDTKHTINFKNFFLKYKDNPNVIPFDIRTILFPVSPFLIINYNDKNFQREFPDVDIKNLKLIANSVNIVDYFYCFLYFFDLVQKDELLHNKYKPIISHIKVVKKKIISCFKKLNFKDEIYIHFKKIKNMVSIFKIKFLDNNKNITIAEFIKKYDSNYQDEKIMTKNLIISDYEEINNYNWINFIEIISDYIIEFYGILLLFCYDKKYTFIHSGLAHSSNIVNLLRNHYNFESIQDTGVTTYTETENYPIIKNCINI